MFSVGLPACCLKIKSPGSHDHDEERNACYNGYERFLFHNSSVMIYTSWLQHAGENISRFTNSCMKVAYLLE